jgi:hypothetical protein
MNYLTLTNDKEQVELIKALASKDVMTAMKAREAFAAAVGPLIQEVINFAPGFANMYKRLPFNEGENPEIQLDLYYDVRETEFLRVWSQRIAGGLPTNELPGGETLKFTTYRLESAISILTKFARIGRIDVVQQGLNRMVQEFLTKKDLNAAVVALTALAQAETFDGVANKRHVIRTNTAREIVLDDFLAVEELQSRILSAWNGGTPTNGMSGVTDMVFSPEGIRKLKGISFNPVNTKGVVTDIPAHEKLRESIYESAGAMDFYGVNILKDNFLGIGRQYNTVFANAAGSITYPGYGASGTAAFNPATEEVAFGANLAAFGLVQPVQMDAETGAEVTVSPDDQWARRSKKIGFSAETENGFIQVDARTTCALLF